MAIAKGVSLGPYEILTHIGAGGMGEVWRARDRRIGRDVAVKVLPEVYGEGDSRLERFAQEARAAGALNHPGLVTIFDVGTTGGAPYIVMELLEGQTLRDALGDGKPVRLPTRKAIDYAMQIATALAVAHEKGIMHRDLKPENIFITSEGRVKILDFGLAKLVEDATDVDGRHRTARHLTTAGTVIGTPGYMSPEQVSARPLDSRTDIFSFGTVLYEMLSGQSPFERPTAVETMHTILNLEPTPLTDFDPGLPPALEAIVVHCLEKSPRDRFQSARDLAFQLRVLAGTQNSRPSGAPGAAAQTMRRPWRAALVAAGLLALGVAGGFALRRVGGGQPQAAPRTFRQLTYADGVEAFPTLAPDGKSFAYVSSQSGNRDIYVQRVDGRIPMNITSDSPADDTQPAFSPDGSQIAFRSERDGRGIFVMGVTGESVLRLTEFGYNPSWAPDGTRLVFTTASTELEPHFHPRDGALWIVDVRSRAKRLLKEVNVGGSDAVLPSWSPHGKRIAYYGGGTSRSWDIWTIAPDAPDPAKTIVRVTSDLVLDWNPVWAPDGKTLYFGSQRDGTLNLWRIGIDEESGEPIGQAEPLSLPGQISGNFTVAQNGDLAFATVTRSYRLLALPFDAATGRTGTPRPLFGGPQGIDHCAPSPDGKSIAFTTAGGQEDLFVANADGTRPRQLTSDAARDRGVTWSPDGKFLYFYSDRDGPSHIWRIAPDGSGLTRVTDDRDLKRIGTVNAFRPSVSPDGRTLAILTDDAQALVHLDRPAGQRIERLGEYVGTPRWSPDGLRLAGTKGYDVVVYSLRTRRSEVTGALGFSPQWLPDGRTILFQRDEGIGMLDLETGRQIITALPAPLAGDARNVLSADGKTLYACESFEQGDVLMMHSDRN